MKLLPIIEIMKFIHFLRYGILKDKYAISSSFFTPKIYMISTMFLKFLAVNIGMFVMDIFIIAEIVQVKWVVIVVINLFLIYYYMFSNIIAGDDQKLKFLTYLKSGLFTNTEHNINVKHIVQYYAVSIILLLGILMVHVNVVIFKMMQLDVSFMLLIIVSELVVLVCYFLLLNKKAADQLLNVSQAKKRYGSVVSFVLTTLFVKYFLEYAYLIEFTIDVYYFISYLTAVLIVIFFFDVFFLLTANKISISAFSSQQNKTLHFLSKTGLIRDFCYREILPKLTVIALCSAVLKFLQLTPFFKNIILVVFILFITSQYNQRYLLNSAFLDYCALVSNNKKLLAYIGKKLLLFPLCFTLFLTFIINQHMDWFLFVNSGLVITNIIILTGIYLFQFNLKVDDKNKLRNIEILTFLIFLIQVLIGYGVSVG